MLSIYLRHKIAVTSLLLCLGASTSQGKELRTDIPAMFYNTLTNNAESTTCGNLCVFILLMTLISVFFFILSFIKKMSYEKTISPRWMFFVLFMGVVLSATVLAYYDQGSGASFVVLWFGSCVMYGIIKEDKEKDPAIEMAEASMEQWKREDHRNAHVVRNLDDSMEKWGSRIMVLGGLFFLVAPILCTILWCSLCIKSIHNYFSFKNIKAS